MLFHCTGNEPLDFSILTCLVCKSLLRFPRSTAVGETCSSNEKEKNNLKQFFIVVAVDIVGNSHEPNEKNLWYAFRCVYDVK